MKLPDFSKMSKREKVAVAAAAVIVALVLCDRLVFSPWIQYRNKIKKEIHVLEQSTSGKALLLSRQTSIQSDLTAYQSYLHKGASAEVEMASFLKEIESLAKLSQVSLQEVRPLPSVTGEWFQEYVLEAQYLASLPNWMDFIYRLESSPNLFTIEKASAGAEGENVRELKGSFRIRRLVLLDQPATAKTEE